jgi:MFS family permease
VGWRTALLLLGGICAVIGLPAVMTVTRSQVATSTGDASLSLGSPLRSRTFLLLFIGGVMIGLFDEVVYQHLVPHLQASGLTAALAATILGCASVGYMSGQVIGGSLSDRRGRWAVGAVAALVTGVGLGMFGLAVPGRVVLLLVAFVTGIGLGATIAVRNAALADLFDGPSLGLVTGTYQWSYAIGTAIIGWAGSYVYERLGSYQPVFAASAAAVAIWALCLKAALAAPPVHLSLVTGVGEAPRV